MPCKSVPRGWVWSWAVVKGDPPIFLGGNFFFLISAFCGDTPPLPGPDSGIQSTFGQYASYWNAFLLMTFVCVRVCANHDVDLSIKEEVELH